jgi:adenosylcobyric acid synthase
MGFAAAADVPVLIAGDIDRGGVIASLVGTHAVIEPSERARIRGFIDQQVPRRTAAVRRRRVGRSRGSPHGRGLGVVPWLPQARGCRPRTRSTSSAPAHEIRSAPQVGGADAVAHPPNFDDLDRSAMEAGRCLDIRPAGEPDPGDAASSSCPAPSRRSAISPSWRAGLGHRHQGACAACGHVIGLCGGYQMLGRSIAIRRHREGRRAAVDGLGLLDVATE